MLARLVVVGTALAAVTRSLEQDILSPASTDWIPVASVLSRHWCSATAGCLRITGTFLGMPFWWLSGSQSERGRKSTRKRKRESRAKVSAPAGLGIARTVAIPGHGTVTYGELAVEELRKKALRLRQHWSNKETFVGESVGRVLVTQTYPANEKQIKAREGAAVRRFRARTHARLRQAAILETKANRIMARLREAGVEPSSSGGDRSPQPGTSDQAHTTTGDESAPGTASPRAQPPMTLRSYVQLGIRILKQQAKEIKEIWEDMDIYVERRTAYYIASHVNPYPSDRVLDECRNTARKAYRSRGKRRKEEAAKLEAQADMWEKWLASGAILHDDPGEGTSSRQRVETTATAVPSDPLVSGTPPAAAQTGSLSGTVLGSTVTLERLGSVSYAQLAVDALTREASYLLYRWGNEKGYVRAFVAENLHRGITRSPGQAQVRKWIGRAQSTYDCLGQAHVQQAASLINIANDIRRKAAAAGIEIRSAQETRTHGPPSSDHLAAPQAEGLSSGHSRTSTPRKKKEKRKHIAESSGEGPSSTGATGTSGSLWFSPVAALPLAVPRPSKHKGGDAAGRGAAAALPQQLQPSGHGSQQASGELPADQRDPLTIGRQIPTFVEAVHAAQDVHIAAPEGGSVARIPPISRKQRLLQFVTSQAAALSTSPPAPVHPVGRPAPPSQTPGLHQSSGSQLVPPSQAAGHATAGPPHTGGLQSWYLPLKKRPLRGLPLPVQPSTTGAPQSGHSPSPSGPLGTSGT
uniref:KRUF family protein n=1 Tax=Neospora caninum (strain Liverpool) TaxID=572307 RepID=A0A0F7UFD5_NEOCL|nr:TPA: hypothetical protein BN1204_043740 [Neospora caninum Liverpool]